MGKRIIRPKAYGMWPLRKAYNFIHRNDEIFYYPIYNINAEMNPAKFKIYNENGEPMDNYFIRDFHRASNPGWKHSRYFIWDRYNYGLDTHFYTHQAMVETMGHPTRKYGMLIESRTIAENDYSIFKKNKGLEREFEAILTFDDQILNEVENAKFYPSCAQVWYGERNAGHVLEAENHQNKTKNISILSSDKAMCLLHKMRIETARYCKRTGLADAYGTFDGGGFCSVDDTLRDYRYSIIIENSISDYFFTEKITNCFAAQAIPIYLGARKINEFFNEEGIIPITENDLGNIERVVKQCTKEEYERRLPAVLDNFARVQEYLNMDDYLYIHYTKK